MSDIVFIIYAMFGSMTRSLFGIAGIGPKKEQALVDAGYPSVDSLKEADIYEIASIPGFGLKTTYYIFECLDIPIHYPEMRLFDEPMSGPVSIENKFIKPWREYKKTDIIDLAPEDYKCERTTVWSYPKRGAWATHNPQYRGNWPPQVARNIIELYSSPGDIVLDPMVGGGTTPVECKLLERNSISVDINPDAARITLDRLDFDASSSDTNHQVYVGDVRNLDLLEDESIDLIATHPPYVNIIHYAPLVRGDLSGISDYKLFFKEFRKAISEMFRVLKPGRYCAVMIGDTHSSSHFVPFSTHMMLDFLATGFILKEDIIKKEWNCESDRYLNKYGDADFLLTMHEHIFVFRKPNIGERNKNSSIEFFESY